MKKLALAMVLALGMAAAMPPAVSDARPRDKSRKTNKKGRFGLGYDTSLAGLGGMSARMQLAQNFGLQFIFAYSRVGYDTLDPTDVSKVLTTDAANSFQGALRGDVTLAANRATNLNLLFGADVVYDMASHEDTVNKVTTDASAMRFAFELGLRAEYHFTHFFSIHGAFGSTIALVKRASQIPLIASRDGRTIVADTTDTVDVDGSVLGVGFGDSFGTLGATFWFP